MSFRSVFAIGSGKLLPLCLCAQLWNSTLWTPEVWTMLLRALIWQARICPKPFRGRKRKGVPWFQFGSSLTQALLKLQPQLVCPYKYIGAQYGSYSSNYHNTPQLLTALQCCSWSKFVRLSMTRSEKTHSIALHLMQLRASLRAENKADLSCCYTKMAETYTYLRRGKWFCKVRGGRERARVSGAMCKD